MRAHSFLCSLLVHLGLHINFSKSALCLTQTFYFLGVCWDTVHMSISLPSDKLADIQQLALSLLQTQPVSVCQVMSFWGKANFCANGHYWLQRLCCVIQSDMLTVYHPHLFVFSCSLFLLIFTSTGTVMSFATEPSFLFLMWLLLLMPCPLNGPFIFMYLVCHY